jgi:hypothetical protein
MALRCFVVALILVTSIATGQTEPARHIPDITGAWTGTWSSYNPAQAAGEAKELCKRLDCKVEYKNGVWEATFEETAEGRTNTQ